MVRRIFWLAVLLAAVTAIAYAPALRGGFVWDDDTTLTNNPLIRAGDGLYRIWCTTEPKDYWPVTYSALWFEWRLVGMNPLGYHAVNVALHVVEALLLWRILARLEIPGAYFAAFLFAVHPVNVESVAWITQQKNLWAMLFCELSVFAFIGGRNAPSLIFFLLAMLSKGSAAPLPLVLAGLVLWRRPLARGDILRLAPFFALSAAFVLVDLNFQSRVLQGAVRLMSPADRVLGAASAIWFYLGKALLPINLAFIYPQWTARAHDPRWWIPFAAALALTGVLWRCRGNPRVRGALFTWGYYCAMLLPVLGLTDVYFMIYSPVADHYQHLAIAGLLAWVGFMGAVFTVRLPAAWRYALAGFVVCVLATESWSQCRMYNDLKTLYSVSIEKNPKAWLAHFNLGEMFLEEGRLPEAMMHFEDALLAKPDYMQAHNNLGIVLAQTGHMARAAAQFREAIRLKPDYAPAHVNLGKALLGLGEVQGAVDEFREAIRYKPDYVEAHRDLEMTLQAIQRDHAH